MGHLFASMRKSAAYVSALDGDRTGPTATPSTHRAVRLDGHRRRQSDKLTVHARHAYSSRHDGQT
jgi:hypothetical protein